MLCVSSDLFFSLKGLNPLLQYVSECESFKDRGGSAKALNLANMYSLRLFIFDVLEEFFCSKLFDVFNFLCKIYY